jgi:hypothetical protein
MNLPCPLTVNYSAISCRYKSPVKFIRGRVSNMGLEKIMNAFDCLLFTGSRYIGGFTEESDWDYVILREDWEAHWLEEVNVLEGEDRGEPSLLTCFNSVKFMYEGELINFIIVESPDDYNAWLHATEKTKLKRENFSYNIHEFDRKKYFGHCLTEWYKMHGCEHSIRNAIKQWGSF